MVSLCHINLSFHNSAAVVDSLDSRHEERRQVAIITFTYVSRVEEQYAALGAVHTVLVLGSSPFPQPTL